MAKREDFLMMVQTDMLLYFNNRFESKKEGYNVWGLAEFSGMMGDAIRASYRIPEDLNCIEAAGDFVEFFLWQKMQGHDSVDCPSWFSELDNRHL